MRTFTRTLYNITFVISSSLVALTNSSSLQFCRVEEAKGTDQCLAISSYFNHTSNANDFYLLLSAKFVERKGYAAFGTGRTMDGALMFIFYPGENEGDVTVSLRSTSFHEAPQTSTLMPDHRIRRTYVKGDYHNAELVCYSCDKWALNGAQVTTQRQPWIFSNNRDFMMKTNDTSAPLTLHTDYDTFDLDMTLSHYMAETPSAPVLMDNGRKSIGTIESMSWSPAQLFMLHGFLLVLSFTMLMPLGAIFIRSGVARAFDCHWVTQLAGTLVAVSSMGLGLVLSWGSIEITQLLRPQGAHQVLGLLLLACVCVQPCLGFLHHIRYLRLRRPTSVAIWHRRLGVIVLVGGWINEELGLYIANAPAWTKIITIILITVSVTVIWFSPKLRLWSLWSDSRHHTQYRMVNDNEEENGIGEDEDYQLTTGARSGRSA